MSRLVIFISLSHSRRFVPLLIIPLPPLLLFLVYFYAFLVLGVSRHNLTFGHGL